MKLFVYTLLALWSLSLPAQAAHSGKVISPDGSKRQADDICNNVVSRLWVQTDAYWHLGDYPRIVALDRIITEADPHFVECYVTGAWLMDSLGRKKDAEVFYRMGAANNRDCAYAYYHLGMFYATSVHNYPSALDVFKKDVKIPGADINDWKMLAHSYERNGDITKALATWQYISTKWPHGPGVDINLIRVTNKAKAHKQAGAAGQKSLFGA